MVELSLENDDLSVEKEVMEALAKELLRIITEYYISKEPERKEESD